MPKGYFITALLLATLAATMGFSIVHAKPSIPEFTVTLEAYPYDIPPTYGTDPYTGENVTIQEGFHVENKSVIITIRNQYSSSSCYLFYNVRFKGHFGEDWIQLYSYDISSYSPGNLVIQSDSEYTVLSIPLVEPFNNGAKIDFQVEALQWQDVEVWISDHPGITGGGTEQIGHYETKTTLQATSSWSSLQTLTISESQMSTPSPAITPTPTPEPTNYTGVHLTEQEVIIFVAVAIAGIGFGLGLIIYRIKRK